MHLFHDDFYTSCDGYDDFSPCNDYDEFMMTMTQVMGRRQGGAGRGRLRAARSEDFLNR